jgi:hypothetical protein
MTYDRNRNPERNSRMNQREESALMRDRELRLRKREAKRREALALDTGQVFVKRETEPQK